MRSIAWWRSRRSTRVQIDDGFFSLAYIHIKNMPDARIGIHSPTRKETHLIDAMDWGNIWVYGMDILLAGYLTREEFTRRASFVQAGARVFQYDQTRTKNLAVTVSDLKPLSELFERVKEWSAVTVLQACHIKGELMKKKHWFLDF